MDTENGAGAFLPLGDFLTTEEPVWVWDATARRILWANRAGRAFWGAETLDALRSRRFSSRSKAVGRLTSLAVRSDGVNESVEALTFDSASGRTSLKCYVQALQIAGGRPGLIVKALDYANGGDSPPASDSEATKRASASGKAQREQGRKSKSDRAALDAIASRLKAGPAPQDRQAPAIERPAASSFADAPGREALALSIREFAHEMRNPLTVILGFAERIKEIAPAGRKQDQLCAYADDILEGANLALAILVDFSARIMQPEEGARQAEPVDLRSAIISCLRLVAPLARTSGIKVYRRTDSHLPPLFTGDSVLKQILLNLLMNALRHHKTGGQIKVTARRRGDGSVRLTVADDGKGMTKKEINSVLRNMRRRIPPPSGRSGLGLPLVKRLVEETGGKLAIESKRGKGTTAEIIFPAAD